MGEDQDALAGGEDEIDDLLEAGELARPPGERLSVVVVGGGVVADLLERRDRCQDRPLARAFHRVSGLGDELVEHGLVQPDLLGGHRAVVELVDLVRELGGDLGLALGAAEQQHPVERSQCGLAVAGHLGGERCARGPTRPGLVKSRIAQRSPTPFSIGVPVNANRVRAGMRRSCCAVSLAGFLIACASSSTIVAQSDAGQRLDIADCGGIGGDDQVGLGDLLLELRVAGTSRPVMNEHAQIGCEAGGLGCPVADHRCRCDHERGATGRGACEVGQHGGCLAEPHVEREATAELAGVEEPDPRQRLGLVRAQRSGEMLGREVELDLRIVRPVDDLPGPAVAVDDDAAAKA